ncbi:MAG TPA: branched-chain amino acid ABC transporter permease [Stellaceae bacterium]|nr:branched-chain amino acid ABC transporter permease [Stellaceae bacterium]
MVETREQRAALLGLAVLAILPWAADAIGQGFVITLASRVLINALAAVSLDLILGFGGLVSFGHAAFFGIGGYVVGILAFHAGEGEALFGLVPGTDQALIALPAAVAVASLAALAIGALSLRTSGVHFIMITLAFAQMVYFLFVSLKTYGGDDGLIMSRRDGFPGIDLRDNTVFYYLCLAALAAFLALCDRLVGSRFGMVIRGCRENERRMAALGYATYGYKLTAFAIAGAGAGLAGALLANHDKFASPDMLHWTKSGELMVMVILGGMGTLYGAVLGAFLLIGLESLLAAFTDHWMFVLGPVLILVILFADRGLWGALAGASRDG